MSADKQSKYSQYVDEFDHQALIAWIRRREAKQRESIRSLTQSVDSPIESEALQECVDALGSSQKRSTTSIFPKNILLCSPNAAPSTSKEQLQESQTVSTESKAELFVDASKEQSV
jgi:hypothetical protein